MKAQHHSEYICVETMSRKFSGKQTLKLRMNPMYCSKWGLYQAPSLCLTKGIFSQKNLNWHPEILCRNIVQKGRNTKFPNWFHWAYLKETKHWPCLDHSIGWVDSKNDLHFQRIQGEIITMREQRLKAHAWQVLCVLNHRVRKWQNNLGGKGCPKVPPALPSCSEHVVRAISNQVSCAHWVNLCGKAPVNISGIALQQFRFTFKKPKIHLNPWDKSLLLTHSSLPGKPQPEMGMIWLKSQDFCVLTGMLCKFTC